MSTTSRVVTANLLVLATVAAVMAATVAPVRAQEAVPQANALGPDLEAGRVVYERRCLNCHGDGGRGDGPAADRLQPRPRDFTRGLYKIRSTPSGELPTDDDLFKAVSRGLFGTAMPAWEDVLTEPERRQVVQYIKTFSKRFGRQKTPPTPVAVGKPVASSSDSIAKGKQLFRDLECWKCHGEEGRADGPSSHELRDDWDQPIRPANLTRSWNFRGGSAPEDIYLRVITGLAGTPMPSFADVLDSDKAWHLVNYVRSLSPPARPALRTVVRARRITEAMPTQPDDPRWEEVEAYHFPLVGQVIREPRMFTPTVNGIWVKVAYNAQEIAVWLAWDDPTHSRPQPASGDVPEVLEDAVTVQFPVRHSEAQGLKKPYFLMGNPGDPVNLWRWSAGTERAAGTGAMGGVAGNPQGRAAEFDATAMDQMVPSPNRTMTATTLYQHGQYRIVLRRPLVTPDAEHDVQFGFGQLIPIAFFVWDGSNGEAGSRMAISHWYTLLLEPPTPRIVYVVPPLAALIAVGVEWWVVKRLRRKKKEEPS